MESELYLLSFLVVCMFIAVTGLVIVTFVFYSMVLINLRKIMDRLGIVD